MATASGSLPISTNPPQELRKKDGSLSKMRSHKGNMPVLPQTKLCPFCPAKFTRSTHLNRHLRNHTNERLYCCDICGAEFTRSDLLSRHKKGCNNESGNSRRKSCVSCTESKIKCDRQSPCSKCASKGKECVYATRTRRSAARAPSNSETTSRDLSQAKIPSTVPFDTNFAQATRFEDGLDLMHEAILRGPVLPPSVDVEHQSLTSSNYYCSATSHTSRTGTDTDAHAPTGSHLSSLYNNDMFEPFFNDLFSQPESSSSSTNSDSPANDSRTAVADYLLGPLNHVPTSYQNSLVASPFPLPNTYTAHSSLQPAISNVRQIPRSLGVGNGIEADDAEHQHYHQLFFTAFLEQVPMAHAPTFTAEGKPPLLTSAMQACGALYVKTRRASAFIMETLAASQEILPDELAKNLTNPSDQVNLILAVLLLQTIGLFHQNSELRATSSLYHGMLIMMIRRSQCISKAASWSLEKCRHLSIEEQWHEWALYEMLKRSLLLSYLHDCCHCIFFSLSPSYQSSEIKLDLPCENELWNAKTSTEWWTLLHERSPYGCMQSRLSGLQLPQLVNLVSEPRLLTDPILISPFAHFVLIHCILRRLFTVCCESRMPSGCDQVEGNSEAIDQEIYNIQFALHNWLQIWMKCPEMIKPTKDEEPPFMQNPLPFYWLGQVALMAYQENLPPFESRPSENTRLEARFWQVKKWLRQIRGFLKKHDDAPTLLWDELMKIRLQSWQIDMEASAVSNDDPHGLLGFFAE